MGQLVLHLRKGTWQVWTSTSCSQHLCDTVVISTYMSHVWICQNTSLLHAHHNLPLLYMHSWLMFHYVDPDSLVLLKKLNMSETCSKSQLAFQQAHWLWSSNNNQINSHIITFLGIHIYSDAISYSYPAVIKPTSLSSSPSLVDNHRLMIATISLGMEMG